VRAGSWRPFGPHAAVTSASIIAVNTCTPGADRQGQQILTDLTTSSPNATLTCSGTAGALVSHLSFW
jgi:hypothetical protein